MPSFRCAMLPLPAPCCPFFFFDFFFFFLRINTIRIWKKRWHTRQLLWHRWLLYQRIINTERHVLICLSPTWDQLTAANCMICSVDVWLPMEPTFFLQGSQCKSLWLLCPKVYTQRQFSTSISHVSIALFDFRVGCHSGVSRDNRVYPELVNALIEQM